ncbi:PAS domain-containing protein [Streptomyces sp. NPDC007100]|uniref:PAS domain-containing protein n=1 Tax=Streptomyces sp. NPDC007100 TaxID=3155602 RepID=UPI0033DE97C0
MHKVLRATAEHQLFQVTAAPYVVLGTDLRICGVNPAYLAATGRTRDDLAGTLLFDAFPDNPEDPTATGVRNLAASLERVLRRGTPHEMGVQRYDIAEPGDPTTFHPKIWSPVNSPLTDADGRVVGALHHVEDITAAHDVLDPPSTGADAWNPARQPPAGCRPPASRAATPCTGPSCRRPS